MTRPPKFTHYTSLNTNKSCIVDEALNFYLIPTHEKVSSSRNFDKNKHCRYHRKYDHTTNVYHALEDKIEDLVQAGHL